MIAKLYGKFFYILLTSAILLSFGCGDKEAVEPKDLDISEGTQPLEDDTSLQTPDLNANSVVARVNGDPILFSELQERMEELIMSLPQVPPPDVLQQQIPALLDKTLDSIIAIRLIEKAVEDEQITVPESDVVKRMRQMAASLPEGRRLSEILKERGSNLENFQEQLRQDMVRRKLLDSHAAEVAEPTSEEIEQFYADNPDQFKVPAVAEVRHILIGFEEDDSDEEKQAKLERIQDIREQIIAGADFEEMAREHSTGPSAEAGGSLGRFPRGQMMGPFDEAAFTQPVGEVGEPVETSFGYHLVLVEDREKARTVPVEEAREDISDHIEALAKRTVLSDYIQQLREDSEIEILRDMSKINVKFNPDSEQVIPDSLK